jgi:hypothetical protein
MKGRPMTEYVQLREAFLSEPSKAKAWLERAFQFASTFPAKDTKKRGATSGRATRTNVRKKR